MAQCDCGNIITTRLLQITSGKTKSCGCLMLEIAKVIHLKHGMASKNNRLYKIWCNMKTRCYNKNNDHFNAYGGRKLNDGRPLNFF